jgi:rubrerythrin
MGGTREALQQAYTGEAKAALRLKVFAEKAEEEGYPQMAKLFRVIAWSEEIHGARALRVLKEIKTTEENLAESFQAEQGVAEVAYGGKPGCGAPFQPEPGCRRDPCEALQGGDEPPPGREGDDL